MLRAALAVLLVAACSSRGEPPPPTPLAPRDAAVAVPDGITAIGKYDPASGMHLDDDGAGAIRPRPQRQPGKPIDVTLRSSPPGAIAAVDGKQIGKTPTYWPVTSGVEHEFTFVLDGYAVAIYRFVPITSGVVHATLEPVSSEPDAGVLPPQILAPVSPPAPPTLVSPPDAAVDARPPPPPPPPDAPTPADATSSMGLGPTP